MRSPMELLSGAFQHYKAHARVLTLVFILPALVLYAAAALLGFDTTIEHGEYATNAVAETVGAVVIACASIFMGIALIKAIAEPHMTTFQSAYSFALNKFLPFFLLALASGILIALGLVLLVIPGIVLIVWFTFSQFILVLENKGPIESLKGSRAYVRDRWFKVAGRLLFLILVMVVLSGALSAIVGFLTTSAGHEFQVIVGQFVSLILAPLSVAYMFLLYQDVVHSSQSAAPAPESASLPQQ